MVKHVYRRRTKRTPAHSLAAIMYIIVGVSFLILPLLLTYAHFTTLTISMYLSNFRYDEAQLRFKKGSKLSDHFYVRQDGTCAYFFDLSQLQGMCAEVGLALEESYYVRRQYANRQQKRARHRVWIHAKFVKL